MFDFPPVILEVKRNRKRNMLDFSILVFIAVFNLLFVVNFNSKLYFYSVLEYSFEIPFTFSNIEFVELHTCRFKYSFLAMYVEFVSRGSRDWKKMIKEDIFGVLYFIVDSVMYPNLLLILNYYKENSSFLLILKFLFIYLCIHIIPLYCHLPVSCGSLVDRCGSLGSCNP